MKSIPRRPRWPVSGGDRKALAKAIREADHAYSVNKLKAAEARSAAARFECDAWHAQIFQGGPMYPSPTMEDAITAGYTGVDLQCKQCGTTKTIDLAAIRRPPDMPIASLDDTGISCKTCGPQRWKLRARLLGLRMPYKATP
ncbi:hypothetical protein OCA5_c23920 [Afipia carboxidovorans OM5]|uniref:Uncharacterized protein n=1 Tax=Afipia carboxidovorans (strain ATCC 49405 / DSM 1227 / KCTC 32145 / OM5) TaxID=504832 RepID=F8C023_AFIC5|nr:hypothetical protein [Afipia carboxidovorans]AEI03511.1 hypothetical protein OCA4_c23910 [Afipia carboxidovorans OM4]AEI07088.1 hypothetical protein OCA5_c23920 [Afipia carboxidovorans OM5]